MNEQTTLAIACPKCGETKLVYGQVLRRTVLDPITGKSTEIEYREVACIAPGCDFTGEYVPWRETSSGNSTPTVLLPLTQPPPRSNTALILDAQRLVLASEPSCGVAVMRAQSFEQAEYIVWCAGTVLHRVRTAQRELVAGKHASYRYHHVWDAVSWDEFFTQFVQLCT